MNALLLTIPVLLAAGPVSLVHAEAPPASANTQQDAAPRSLSARPSDEAIRAAVRATLDEFPDSPPPAGGTALSGGPYREFARKFSEAEKPHCMGPNALKHQPAGFSTKNWNFGFGGLAALPFWGAAIARGKCSWNR
ncbi:MAG: hypothetical protein EOP92_19545 [Lysobacteraceae bacterium]|nr:MAG: hypothetical protein EOP92_19545 [Xanthomonadaceae bacterium]